MNGHNPGDCIAQRYQIINILGSGGTGTTYAAQDQKTGQKVALKALSLVGMTDWKVLELFEREAKVLSRLNHPAIPKYLDYFQVETPQNRCFYLVQELAPGTSLSLLVKQGWQPDEVKVLKIARQILEILDYLHNLNPPVIHRDINPQNIILAQKGNVFLVDFGAVQNVYRNTLTQGSTVVGTYGYMAPEQFRGQGYITSDLYGLGATLLFLVTHRSPGDLPQRRLKIDFRAQVQSEELANWLEKMLEPVAEDRFASAQEALIALQGEIADQNSFIEPPVSISNRIFLEKHRDYILVDIPFLSWYVVVGSLIVFIGLICVWPFIIAILPLLIVIRDKFLSHIYLKIDKKTFQLQWQILGLRYWRKGRTADIDRLEIDIRYNSNGQPIRSCAIVEGVRTHRFGKYLKLSEKDWLVQELNGFLEQLRS
ncbi:MAG: serine/threonine-protein kinase [Coleofasciculus sp. G3-WIS-01]|uniref:serine/threonine protein kinase n=1 Tax=Coleofasciculus sp. G3-WIS-01 TaxID=3069528 RepID=UPI0032F7EE19